ncbi:DNA starvation/stationary phase protection protein [Spongiactinospora sp. TRM90649]|uniref:Dps family protein n=1 Tax=Spongiactinospora sp. TRM90649 TaxID=3031114 RepID=UPI0023FA2FDF|nr:DNA starvation/stationary phase protection protein [Spongiactinospora sp. TRM90649]MDF5758459.1 DNA starvation/stationary phase protection protein [Spongiactinospora sp. TRM90649]
MAAITGSLRQGEKKAVAEALQGALIDMIDLSLLGKQAHWNVIGHHFRPLHLQLDEIVALAREHTDVMAERAVALGLNPDGRAATVARASELPQLELGWINDGKVVAALTDVLEGIVKRMRERVRATEEPDPVTQDLLIKATQDLEKQHWMMQAQR